MFQLNRKQHMSSTIKLINLDVSKHGFSLSPPKPYKTTDEKGGEIVTNRSYINPKISFTVKGKGRLTKGKSQKYDSYTTMICISAEERARLDSFGKWLCDRLVEEKYRKFFGNQRDGDILYKGGMFKKFCYSEDKEEDHTTPPIAGRTYCIYTKVDLRPGSPYKVPSLDKDGKLLMQSMPIEKALSKEIDGEYAFTISNVCNAAGSIRLQFALNAVTVMDISNGPVDLAESDATRAFVEENRDRLVEISRKILGDLQLDEPSSNTDQKDAKKTPLERSGAQEETFVDRSVGLETDTSKSKTEAIKALLLKSRQAASQVEVAATS